MGNLIASNPPVTSLELTDVDILTFLSRLRTGKEFAFVTLKSLNCLLVASAYSI